MPPLLPSGWVAGCPQKPSGNTRHVEVQQHLLAQETISQPRRQITTVIIHIITMQRENIAKKLYPLEVLRPMRLDCLICTAMCVNGAAIGMAIIPHRHRPIPKVHHRGRSACSAAVAGLILRTIAGRRTAPASLQTTATALLASAWSLPSLKGRMDFHC